MSPRKKQAVLLLNPHAEPSPDAIRTLLGDDRRWILTEPLVDVFISLLVLYLKDSTLLDAEIMAFMTKRLIASERTVGGPYGNDDVEGLEANAAIAQLFTQFGSPLPKVNAYVLDKKHVATTPLFTLLLEYPGALDHPQQPSEKPVQEPFYPAAHAVEGTIGTLHEPVKKTTMLLWQEMKRTHSYREIMSFSKDFGSSLIVSPALPNTIYDTLGQANAFFWLAYTIYDDFIDEEADSARLSVANIAHRKSFSHYESILEGGTDAYLTAVDEANAWELAYCRFATTKEDITIGTLPLYKDNMLLARRAHGHILGPLAVARLINISKAQEKQLYEALCHYLIARQLNDDLHDWAEDAQKGHISPVVAMLMKGAGIPTGRQPLDTTLRAMRSYFFKTGVTEVCNEVLRHTKAMRLLLRKTGLFDPDGPFFAYGIAIEDTAKAALTQHRQHRAFLKNYTANK